MDAKGAAQRTKHEVFVAHRRAKGARQRICEGLADLAYPKIAEFKPYSFDRDRYRRSFLVREAPTELAHSKLLPRVFCFWTGRNELSTNRLRSLELLRARVGAPVVLVTPDSLEEWIVPGHPIHSAYEYLSLVHRSDYLRAYFMHHHGGGYADIKVPLGPWVRAFDRLERNSDKWLLGYREIGVAGVTRIPGSLGRDLRRYRHQPVGCGAFIARPNTPFTFEWLREVERRMDYYAPQLREFPGGDRGAVVGYPISWTRLLGRVFHPLGLKYMERLIIDDSVKLIFEDYQ